MSSDALSSVGGTTIKSVSTKTGTKLSYSNILGAVMNSISSSDPRFLVYARSSSGQYFYLAYSNNNNLIVDYTALYTNITVFYY